MRSRGRGDQTLPVAGLGGSAGSLAALQTFFVGMPANSGMAFVVILHLSPEHESLMAEILQRSSAMPVIEVRTEEEVHANRVYVIYCNSRPTLTNPSTNVQQADFGLLRPPLSPVADDRRREFERRREGRGGEPSQGPQIA